MRACPGRIVKRHGVVGVASTCLGEGRRPILGLRPELEQITKNGPKQEKWPETDFWAIFPCLLGEAKRMFDFEPEALNRPSPRYTNSEC